MKYILNYLIVLVFTIPLTPNTTLAQKKLPALTDWFLSTGNWSSDPQLYVYELGTGPDTVVMLHGGWGAEHRVIINMTKGLTDKYHFIFYDQRGSLRSPVPDSLISYDNHIEDLELLRKELKINKLTIVAHSMGAVLASAYASKYADQIAKLVFISPAYLKNPIPEEDLVLLNESQSKFQEFFKRPEIAEELNTYSLSRNSPALSSKEESTKFRIYFAARMLYDVRNWQKLRGGRTLYKGHVFPLTAETYPESGWDFPAFFQKQKIPLTLIMGDHDFLDFGAHLNSKWAKQIPQAKLTQIKEAGHFLWLDQPNSFKQALEEALKR